MSKTSQITKEKNFVSCVLYLYNDQERVASFVGDLCAFLDGYFEQYEWIFVNDGCTDETMDRLRRALEAMERPPVATVVNLGFYQGVEAAMNAGRDLAVGDYVFEFDSCTEDFSPELVGEIYQLSQRGADVAAAVPSKPISLSSRIFYGIYNLGTSQRSRLRQERFRVISRRAINRVAAMGSYIPYRKALYLNCGLRVESLVYENSALVRRQASREEWGSRSGLAMDTIIIFTDVLERLSLLLSVGFFAVLLGIFGYIIQSYFSKARPVEGWMSMMSLISFGFFVLFLMLTLIFKYLSLILNMNFKKQRYLVEGVEKLR